TPEETRQLFTVVKALADFPNVVYLMAFDREVAAQAIGNQGGLPGDRYLEKIIQVPFELPPVDRVALRAALLNRLDEVLVGTPDYLFDKAYWTNVFFDGIDALIQVPRDIVRFSNTLAITYPTVIGEVNPVDFVAIEALRVFLPDLYDTIRTHHDRFAGHSSDDHHGNDRQTRQAFHDTWAEEIPEVWRSGIRALLGRLFPKIQKVGYGADWLERWRKDLRVCHPEVFPIYFRLSLPIGAVSHQEMKEFIGLLAQPVLFKELLSQSKTEKRPDGLSKARVLLERLMDHVEADIPEVQISTMCEALLDVGDNLLDPADERGMFDFGTVSRIARPVYNILKRVDADKRVDVLEVAIRFGRSIAVQRYLISYLETELSKSSEANGTALLDETAIARIKTVWLEKVRDFSQEAHFLNNPELPRVLAAWRHWGCDSEVRKWCDEITRTDEGLIELLSRYQRQTKSQTFGDWAIRHQPRLNPSWLEPYIDTVGCAQRLREREQTEGISEPACEAVSQYLKEFEILQSGRNPDDSFDD
ncbi:MAG: P-loop NTPase fold protein, partial [Deltaproteobacteria bacterium]